MKFISTSPAWPVATFLIALSFIGWGISLIFSVERQQEKVRDYVGLIAQLSSLENSIREFDKILFEEGSGQPIDSALYSWRNQYIIYNNQRNIILVEKNPVIPFIHPFLTRVDSCVNKINSLFLEQVAAHPDNFNKNSLERQLHIEMNDAINLTRDAISIIRTNISILSTSLIAKWQSLYILVFVSCLLAIVVTVVLHFFQRALAKHERTEAVLRQLTAEFRAMFKSIPDAVFFTDINHEIIMVNPAFSVLFGYQPEEVIGREPSFLFSSKKDFASINKKEYKSDNGKLIEPDEIKYRRKNGDIFISESVGTIVKDRDGVPFGFMNIIRDISRRKKTEEALSEAYEKLEQWVSERTEDLMRANDEVKRFAYIVSHDLRAPLVNIKGFAGELRQAFETISAKLNAILPLMEEESREEVSDILKEEIPEALQFIDSSASRMGHLIDAVLKLSRLGRRELHFEGVNVRVLVQQVLDSLAHQIDQQDITVQIKALPRVVADRTSVEQIFGNILGNAVNYLIPGRRGKIEIGGKRGRHEVEFYIRDNGRGISERDMPKVFEPFSRAGSPDVPGEGMGLAYVQTLIRRHGGRIWCESEIGEGTVFYFTLPNQTISEKVIA